MRNLQRQIHQDNVEKGWWATPRTALEIHMLIVSEVAEATEHVREGHASEFIVDGKPDGEAVELADAVIRIMDYFESKGWDLEGTIQRKLDYNQTRPYRHGGKTA